LDQVSVVRGVSFALFGLIFGSFLTVVIYRVPRKESIVAPRSACPSCGAPVRPRDNIPVASYLLLRGRCRNCGTRISAFYPIVEALTAGLFLAAAAAFQRVPVAAVVAVFLGVLLACALIDLRHRIIPNRLVYPSLVLFAAAIASLALAHGGVSVAGAGLALLAYGGGLLVVSFISPGGMGMGDVKLAALIGLVLGALGWRYVLVAAMVAVFAGGLGAVVALVLGKSRKDTLPFGPYLGGGAMVAALLAPQLASWYLHVFA
jgi:leader peptidase (prepilin peptidase)/N-methyltransferase